MLGCCLAAARIAVRAALLKWLRPSGLNIVSMLNARGRATAMAIARSGRRLEWERVLVIGCPGCAKAVRLVYCERTAPKASYCTSYALPKAIAPSAQAPTARVAV